mmetsp:Transcript_83167/g.174096  ORF Transcript_83167/g.174096 Transcript_83167/m.174096 type:complete len:669 (-) Transcript_83167:112-2118(-)
MQGLHVLFRCHQLGDSCCMRFLVALQFALHLGLGGTLLSESLGVSSTLGSRIAHQSLVVFLTFLLLGLSFGHFLVQVLDEKIHHRDDTVVVFRLGAVGTPSGRWGCRGILLGCRGGELTVLGDLRQDCDTSASNATRSLSGRRGSSVLHKDLLLLRQLLLRRRLVQGRVVELVEAVLGEIKEILGSTVGGHQRLVLLVLSLAQFSRLCDRLVEGLNACLQVGDLLCEGGNALLGALDGGGLIVNRTGDFLTMVVGHIELTIAEFLLVVIVDLFFLQHLNHLVDHSDHFVETALATRPLGSQSERHELQLCPVLALGHLTGRAQQAQSLAALSRGGGAHLDQACSRRRKSLLEEIQSVIIVKHLDGVCQGDKLLGPSLGALLPLSSLGATAGLQLLQVLLVLEESGLGVGEVLLHLNDGDTKLTNLCCLHLDSLGKSCDFLVLGFDQCLEALDRLLLGARELSEGLGHLVADFLEDTSDFAALGCVGSALSKEGGELTAVVVGDLGLPADSELPEDVGGRGLQEASGHALLQSSHSLVDSSNVGVILGLGCGEGTSFLFSKGGGIADGCLRRGAVFLGRLQVGLGLVKLLLRGFDVGGYCRFLARGSFDGSSQVTLAVLAVAHELIIELLFSLALFLHLLLHGLKKGDHLADGVHGALGTVLGGAHNGS